MLNHYENGESMKKLINLLFLLTAAALFNSVDAANLQEDAYQRLYAIQAKIHLKYGDLRHELPEQLLTTIFLPADAKVLELGADVGRNSCVIATILKDSRNMVTVEPRLEAIPYLRENRDVNNLKFYIEPSAISKIPLVQKGWSTIPSAVDLPGYTRVQTITYEQLQKKYGIKFDTLIIDCEGAFYYILRDEPNILNNIKLIIIENDFSSAEHYQFVADQFRKNGFEVIHNEGPPHWDENSSFYQVWAKQ